MKEFVTLIKHKEFAKAKRLLKKALQTEPDNVYLLTRNHRFLIPLIQSHDSCDSQNPLLLSCSKT